MPYFILAIAVASLLLIGCSEQLQQGVKKVADAVKAGQEGIEQAKEALSVSGTEKEKRSEE